MAYTTVQRRLPGSSDFGGELSETKRRLVEEMSEFTKEGDRVNPTDAQVVLAEQLVRSNDQTRYVKIPFGNIVQQNRVSKELMYINFLCEVLLNEASHISVFCVMEFGKVLIW